MKRLTAVLLAVLLSLPLTACDGGGANPAGDFEYEHDAVNNG